MLLNGINQVAILTNDTDRLHAFYRDMFDAVVVSDNLETNVGPGVRMSQIGIGGATMLNVFQIDGNSEAEPGVSNPPGTPSARYAQQP